MSDWKSGWLNDPTPPPEEKAPLRLVTSKKKSARRKKSVSAPVASSESTDVDLLAFDNTETGNAHRLLALHGDEIRFCSAIGWMTWTGTHWATSDGKGGRVAPVMARLMEVITQMKEQCASSDDVGALAAFKWATKSGAHHVLQGSAAIASYMDAVRVEVGQLDADPFLLSTASGTLDLRLEGGLRDPDPADLITKHVGYNYVPDAPAPKRFLQFLHEIMPDDTEEMIAFLQRALGSSLVGVVRDHALYILYGIGANGKSTLLGTVLSILGPYAQTMAAETLFARKQGTAGGAPTPEFACLRGARLVAAIETRAGKQFDEGVIKKLTGGDTMRVRHLFKEQFDLVPSHTLFLAVNHRPEITDTTLSIWRRVQLVNFPAVIDAAKQNERLKEELLEEEGDQIFTWLVQGCRDWQATGLRPPASVVAATEAYRAEQDVLSEFAAIALVKDRKGQVENAALEQAYKVWATRAGISEEERVSLADLQKYIVQTYGATRHKWWNGSKDVRGLAGIKLVPLSEQY